VGLVGRGGGVGGEWECMGLWREGWGRCTYAGFVSLFKGPERPLTLSTLGTVLSTAFSGSHP
jgi:hypothetical protein